MRGKGEREERGLEGYDFQRTSPSDGVCRSLGAAYLVAGSKEVTHLFIILSTLQGQVPGHLHKPASLVPIPVPLTPFRETLLSYLNVGYKAMQGAPGGQGAGGEY